MYNYKKLISYTIAIIIAFLFMYYYFTSFVAIAGSFVFSILGLLLFANADDKILGNIDTYKELIDEQNVAYAITLLAISIIIGAGIISGSLIFYTLR